MKYLIAITAVWLAMITSHAQSLDTEASSNPFSDSRVPAKFKAESWTVLHPDGSIEFSQETILLISDSNYRQAVYPNVYQLTAIPELIKQQKIMLSLWTAINLYGENPEEIKTITLNLARRGIKGQHYLSSFYTYVFADPEIFAFDQNAAPQLINPLIMEEKLAACQSLATLADYATSIIQSNLKNTDHGSSD